MVDVLPFLRLMGNTPDEQIKDISNYLIQFKEALEFILMNISTDNLSPDLVNQLNELGANIEKSNDERVNEMAQLSQNTTLTISDVVNSEIFKTSVKNEVSNITFNVNFETGNLEYSVS